MVRAVSKYSLRLQNPSSTGVTPSSSPNHREKDRTITQTFVSALHLFKTRILRFTIDHLRAKRVVDVALWRIASDIPRSARDASVHQSTLGRSLGCCHATKRIFPRAAKTHLALGLIRILAQMRSAVPTASSEIWVRRQSEDIYSG
jgi:hypothetical protein